MAIAPARVVEATVHKTASALAQLNPSGAFPSRSFQLLVRAIGEAKTKHEEDRIMKRETNHLKERMAARETSVRQMREYLVRLVYCEMLGQDCSWGYIHAVKFTQNSNLMDKRIGYLASSIFLHENHELNMLLVNTLQRDLRSSNMLEVSMALIVICKLIGEEMIPPLLPLVREKLHHPKELVRKKALLALHHFYLVSPSSISHLEADIRKALSDPDPGVMEASLIILHDLISADPVKQKDLTGAFANILSQVIHRRLPTEFEYHSVPAPWIQIRLLRILALLGADDAKASDMIYSTIEDTLSAVDSGSNIGMAITYECIRTVTHIYPRPGLIKKAADTISHFLTAANNNWKYLGVTSLATLVQVEPKYALDYQMAVIECLDDPDETLKRKTLDLLYQMTNPANVAVITEKLVSYLRSTNDEFIRADLVAKITQLAERFAPDNQWFITTMNAVFELGGDLVRREVAHNLMRLIAEGTEDEETDHELRKNAVSLYIELLDKPHLPDILTKIVCWVVGEYVYELREELEAEDVLEKVTALMNREYEDPRTTSWVINAITRLVAQIGFLPEYVHTQIALHLTATDTEVQQRCSELLEFSQNLLLMQETMPLDSACEDMELDSSLSFLDTYVSDALARGSPAYKPPHLRKNDRPQSSPKSRTESSAIKFEPYAAPTAPSSVPMFFGSQGSPSLVRSEFAAPVSTTTETPSTTSQTTVGLFGSSGSESKEDAAQQMESGINVKGQRKWGKGGYIPKTVVAMATPPVQSHVSPADSGVFSSVSPPSSSSQEGPSSVEQPTSSLSGSDAGPKPSAVEAMPNLAQQRKKELASALFGGLSGPARPVKMKGRSTATGGWGGGLAGMSPPKKATQKGDLERSGGPDLLLDLQDLDLSSSSPSMAAHPDQSVAGPSLPPTQSLPGLEAKTASSFAQPTHSVSDDLIGLFDGPAPSSDSAPSLLTVTPLIPSSLAVGGVAESASTQASAIDLMQSSVSLVQLPPELASLKPIPGWEKRDVASDSQLRLTASKLLKLDQLVLVLLLNNQNQFTASNIHMTVNLPSSVKALTADGSSDLTLNGELSSFGTLQHILLLSPVAPAVNMSLKGEIAYKDSLQTQRRLFFDLTLQVVDFFRPLKIKTPEFGSKWRSMSYEKKMKLSCAEIQTPKDFMAAMETKFNFHPVEIIGPEGIAAGTFLPNSPCYLHGKVTKSGVELWVRSSFQLLTDLVAKHAQAVLK